jgi:hypothetical protein
MVPTAGLEPAQVAPLAPQTSASTNSATSACTWASKKKSRGLAHFGGVGGTGATGVDVGAGAGAGTGFVAGAADRARAAACAARSITVVGSAVERGPMYASSKLVPKNAAANAAVNFENRVAVPRAPNTVPEAPEPNPAPASAPLPRCISTRPMIMSARRICTDNMKPRSIAISLIPVGRSRANLQKLIGAQRCAAHQSTIYVGH